MRDRVNVEHPPATPALFMVILGASEKKPQFNDSDFKAMAGRSNIDFRIRKRQRGNRIVFKKGCLREKLLSACDA